MPPKPQVGKMGRFVQARNPGADGMRSADALGTNAGFEDLKVDVPKGPAPSTSQSRANVPRKTRAGQSHSDGQTQAVRQQPRRPSDGQPAFYDTDASSIGKTSTTMSVYQNNAGAVRGHQSLPAANADGYGQERPSSPEESASGDDESGGELTDDPLQPMEIDQPLSQSAYLLMTRLDAQQERKRNGAGLPYVKGDSYPTTTSGGPSDTDVNDGDTIQRSNWQQQPPSAHQTSLPNRESSHRHQMGPATTQTPGRAHQPPVHGHSVQRSTSNSLLSRPNAPDEKSLKEQATADFSFTKRTNPPIVTRPQALSRQQSAPELPSSKATVSTNTAQPTLVPAAGATSQRKPQHDRHEGESVRFDVTREQHNDTSKSIRKNRTSRPSHAQAVEPSPKYEHLSDVDYGVHGHSRAGFQLESQLRGSEVRLDYPHERLIDMNYAELKAESFDIDPSSDGFHSAAVQQDDSIANRLSAVSELEQQDQAEFFASLPIEEWEQAGDWFLGRFGEVLGKLKDARREKRTAAKLFEDEIQKRHNAVSKKRKQTDEYLNEMKESGGKVLQGTPKKTKTAK